MSTVVVQSEVIDLNRESCLVEKEEAGVNRYLLLCKLKLMIEYACLLSRECTKTYMRSSFPSLIAIQSSLDHIPFDYSLLLYTKNYIFVCKV